MYRWIFELRGCPINKGQLIELISATLAGRKPNIPTYSVCRTIRVDCLARVEGEGALLVKMKGDRVTDVKLQIFEPPRLFEAFLRGRHYSEVPDIVARICGICPVAYQMSAVHAIERALGVQIDPAVRLLRRLFYCGEWIESHALHIFMLHTPDFLGYPDAIQMARDYRGVVEQALRLKKIGNRIVTLIGGREIHPVSAAVGGFYRVPARSELLPLVDDLKWAFDASLQSARLVAGFEFPDFEQPYEFVSLSHPDEYPFNEGRLVSNKGLDIDAADYEEHFVEQHVKHSNALQSALRARGSYMVGPLARFNLNFVRLPKVAQQAAGDAGISVPCNNPFRSIIARCGAGLRLLGSDPCGRGIRTSSRGSSCHHRSCHLRLRSHRSATRDAVPPVPDR
jgi:coenzyme F420-reducing hydrogenase alpha subunit